MQPSKEQTPLTYNESPRKRLVMRTFFANRRDYNHRRRGNENWRSRFESQMKCEAFASAVRTLVLQLCS